jgi:hypothetical protein
MVANPSGPGHDVGVRAPVIACIYPFSTMASGGSEDNGDQDWRLQAELDVEDSRRSLHDLVGRFRREPIAAEIAAEVPHDVVITHDGKLLFAYASDESTLASARRAIENVLTRDAIHATLRVSHWNDELDDWLQTDPPPTPSEERALAAAEHDAEAIETRTLVASSGKLIRTEFEQTMRNWADQLGVQCTIIEHPHLLTTQVGFTVTGPKRKVEEFSQGLAAEERTTIRTEYGVMISSL